MKKSIIGFIFGIILTLSVGSYAITAIKSANYNNTKVALDGEPLTLATDFVTVVNEGQTNGSNFAPIRALFEAVGYTVDWDRPSNTILLESPLTDLETVAKNAKDSCVMIYAYKNGITSQGSGWVYGGYVITAKHVVEGFDKIDIFTDDSLYSVPGTVYYIDPKLDVAVIKADTKMPSVILGDSDKLSEGAKLVSITSPQGTKNIIEECTYSGTMEVIAPNDIGITDTIMTHGSSGGGIFNRNSELVAMNFFGAQNAKGIIGAIPINDLKPILQKLK